MDAFWSTPPVTRTLTALSFGTTVLIIARILPAYYFHFSPYLIFKFPPEVWRIFSSFFVVRGHFQFIFDLFHMYRYGSALEKETSRFSAPGDFFMYVLFVGAFTLLTAGCYLDLGVFSLAMIMAFVYTYALENRGQKVKFFMITMPVQYLPWAFALFELVAGGPVALILSLVGIVAAHTHNFLTQIYPTFGRGKNYLATPAFVRSYFSSNVPRTVHRGYGTAVRGESQREPSSGWASSLQGDWSARGRGRRLGGD